MIVTLRSVGMADAPLLLAWRNDPETRANSLTGDVVEWATHLEWLRATLADPRRKLLIAESTGDPVGTCRADRTGAGWRLSWAVAPHMRGQGVGTLMVQQLAASLAGHLWAEIKADNVPSRRIAEHAGIEVVTPTSAPAPA